jgi:hypothetical protein
MAILETSPASTHPSEDALQRFARGELSRQEVKDIVRHLLGNCAPCRRVTARLWGPGASEPSTESPIAGHWAGKYRRVGT